MHSRKRDCEAPRRQISSARTSISSAGVSGRPVAQHRAAAGGHVDLEARDVDVPPGAAPGPCRPAAPRLGDEGAPPRLGPGLVPRDRAEPPEGGPLLGLAVGFPVEGGGDPSPEPPPARPELVAPLVFHLTGVDIGQCSVCHGGHLGVAAVLHLGQLPAPVPDTS